MASGSSKIKDAVLAKINYWSFYSREIPGLEQRKDNEAWACCPFHNEEEASFSANLTTGLWHCFGCQAGGDVFEFIQKKYGHTFPDALAYIAEAEGVEAPKRKKRARLDYLAEYAAHIVGFKVLGPVNQDGYVPVAPLYNKDHRGYVLVEARTDAQEKRLGSYIEFNGDNKPDLVRSFYQVMGEVGDFADPDDAYQDYGVRLGFLPAKTYDYRNMDGSLAFQVCRYQYLDGNGKEKKDFKQRRPDPDAPNKWIYDLKGVPRIPYRLPELTGASQILVTEGEKDVDNLVALGFTATCNQGGAGNWHEDLDQCFLNKDIVILPDNDGPGQAHAHLVASRLQGLAKSVKIVSLPGLPHKGDVSDWLQMGGGADKIAQLINDTPVWVPPVAPESNYTPLSEPAERDTPHEQRFGITLTDAGNGRYFIRHHGHDLKYNFMAKKWMIYDGRRWLFDDVGQVDFMGKQAIRRMIQESKNLEDPDDKKLLMGHALKTESEFGRQNMIRAARSEVPIRPAQLDPELFVLNVNNGTLDLQTGQLKPHDRRDLITKIAPVNYDPQATCPLWEKTVYEIFDGDQSLIDYMQVSMGYALTGDTREQCFWIFYGTGANGKSTFIDTIRALLGDYAFETPVSNLLENKNGEIPNAIASLDGPRFVTARESDEGRKLAESLIKSLTGQDTMSARFLYGEYFNFVPKFKLFLATNHKPAIRGTDKGIWRRIRLVPFTQEFEGPRKDNTLKYRLMSELPGILNWALAGCRVWFEDGKLDPPKAVQAATEDYREQQDLLSDFINDCCTIMSGITVLTSTLYDAYQRYVGGKGTMHNKTFASRIMEKGFTKSRVTSGVHKGKYAWSGIGLRDAEEE